MFNVVIEDNEKVVDPLILRDDISEIVQSIEEQLYDINVNYRNGVRSIKNKIKNFNKKNYILKI